ncbi:hypothetical protein D6779_11805 [Candidatus Parcubacteria bacterium]|nr:MAG: hypothetical protein D6779_11805 [Candidatus Parcubacteria bacterium]
MTVKYQIIYWRDIPAQVKARVGRERKSQPLPERFEKAIDRAAMYAGLINSDDYLAEWRAGEWQEQEGDPDEVVRAVVAELDAAYPDSRLREMARNSGYDTAP